MVNPARTFAFIVAINQYKHSNDNDFPNLLGPMNDATSLKSFLTDNLRLSDRNIYCLFDQQATRDAILKRFQKDLVENPSIQRGDFIIIYFATHGTRVAAQAGWLTNDGHIEALCPHDMTLGSMKPSKAVYPIPDYTFNALLRKLADKKGNNIVVIADSCYAGSLTRDNEEEEDRYCYDPPSLPDDLDEDLWDDGGVRAGSFQPLRGFHSDLDSHILLASSTSNERSHTLRKDDIPRGVFTYFLLQQLKFLQSRDLPWTYVQLIESVQNLMRTFFQKNPKQQTPQCTGLQRYRRVFSTQTVDPNHDVGFNVSRSNLTVYVDRNLQPYLSSSPAFNVVASQSAAHLIIGRASHSSITLKRQDPLITMLAQPTLSFSINHHQLPHVLEAIASFQTYLYSASNALNQFTGPGVGGHLDITMRLLRLVSTAAPYSTIRVWTAEGGGDLFQHYTARIPSDRNLNYGLEISNRSNKDLFVYVFLFEPSEYSISAWHRPLSSTSPELKASGKLTIGFGSGGGEPMQFYAPQGGFDTSFLKVFVSDSYINLDHLVQPAAFKITSSVNRASWPAGQSWWSVLASVRVG